MIIEGVVKEYIVIPIEELYNEIDILETEILVHGYNKNSELRKIAEIRIKQLEEIIEYYS